MIGVNSSAIRELNANGDWRQLENTGWAEAKLEAGVSTLFLAAAVRDNHRQETHGLDGPGQPGLVIGTEYEPEKANPPESA